MQQHHKILEKSHQINGLPVLGTKDDQEELEVPIIARKMAHS